MKLFSNEIVFRGHPDKVCDQISDAILDECLRQDPNSRCGIETCGGKGIIFVTGEMTTKAKINVKAIVNRVLKEVGYKTTYKVIDNIGKQSPDIALGTNDKVGGAGDQGMMFGYACDDTEQMLPTAMVILQELSKAYDNLRKQYKDIFFPDGKAQITGYYDDDFKLIRIKDFLVSYNNCETERQFSDQIIKQVIGNISSKYNMAVDNIIINPTGKFLVGGFEGDAGLTGRKIVVDSYQSFANVGGGAFSGKDPTKVDRSGAYKAREIAKRYLKKHNLKRCEVQLSYAIGIEEPLAIYIESDKGNIEPDPMLYVECKPRNIILDLQLKTKNYEATARFGHFTE